MEFLPKNLTGINVRVKLILVLTLLSVSISDAAVWYQVKPISIKSENVKMVELFGILQKQTNLRFVYNHEHIEPYTVSVNATDKTLSEILNTVLAGKPLSYELTDKYVIVSALPEQSTRTTTDRPQNITVTGTVTGEDGLPQVGVSVMVKGTYIGTSTDVRGGYSITFTPNPGIYLTFNMLGMIPVELPWDGKTVMNVTMQESAEAVDEVVVTGYYNINKGSFTGASRAISQEELRSAGNQNILTSLRNLDPSFMLVDNNLAGSNPNVLPEFEMRGKSSLSGLRDEYDGNPNMPLFILDGFEVSAEKVYDLDIYRVTSINILKDAAATAIYGSRAANGVVVITSMGPKPGRLYVNYNMDLTFAAADLSAYDVLNAREKLEFEKMAGIYDAHYNSSHRKILLDNEYNQKLNNIESGYDTYWLNKPLNSLTVSHKHTLRLDGGSESFRYMIDANYNDNNGVMKKSGRTRQGLGMTFQYLVGKFTFTNEISYNSTKGVNSPYGQFSEYVDLNPYYRYKDEAGNYIMMLDDNPNAGNLSNRLFQTNPLWNTTLNTKDYNSYDEFKDNLNIVWNVTSGWTVRGSFAVTKQNSKTVVFKPSKHTDFARWVGEDFEKRGYYQSRTGDAKTIEGKVATTYQRSVGLHTFTGNAVWEIREKTNSWEQVKAEGFPNDKLNDLGSALQYVTGTPLSSQLPYRFVGAFASLNYVYDNRYLADLTGRTEASSQFGSNKRWAPFWSAGLGWNIHNESFFSNIDIVNRLKVRGSYGMTGSVDYDPFQAMSTYRYMTGTRYHWGQGAGLMALGNDDLGWQKTYQFNAGVDLDMWNDRIMLTFDFYNKISKDVLTSVTLPPSLGFSSYMENLGEVQNKGVEVNLRVTPIKNTQKSIILTLYGTAAHNKNKLRKISDALTAYNQVQDSYTETGTEESTNKDRSRPRVRYIEGASMNSIWVNPSLGIDAVTGREVFIRPDGTTTTEWSSSNYVIGGCRDPKLIGTFGLNFQYRRFRLNAGFYYSFGGDIYNQTLVDRVQDADYRKNVDRRVFTDRWFKPGDISKYTTTVPGTDNTNFNALTKPTSRFIERENYLEMTTINASYELDPALFRKTGLSQLRITFYANDLFRASTVKQERGINYPFARNFSVGIQARF